MEQIKSNIECSGLPDATSMIRNTNALRQAYCRRKKKLLRQSEGYHQLDTEDNMEERDDTGSPTSAGDHLMDGDDDHTGNALMSGGMPIKDEAVGDHEDDDISNAEEAVMNEDDISNVAEGRISDVEDDDDDDDDIPIAAEAVMTDDIAVTAETLMREGIPEHLRVTSRGGSFLRCVFKKGFNKFSPPQSLPTSSCYC
jgi:hypothetical protein